MTNFYKITVMIMICFFIGHSAFADVKSVTVDGFCYLEGAGDHSGTKVLFTAVSPSAQTDSTYTNADGFYSIGLSEGIYTVHYSHDGWQPYSIPGELNFFENTTLEDVVLSSGLVEEVSGPQSGVWTSDYLYQVIGDIWVSGDDTLVIEPGTTIKFMGYYYFNISGALIAAGNETDSIFFTSGQSICNPGDWYRIKFEDSSNDNSIISYARIEYANRGIYCYKSSPIISNNNISNNNDRGICSDYYSSPTISNNIIRYNGSGDWYDAGIYCEESSPIICNNTISDNNGNGIYCSSFSPTIFNNTISDNNGNGIHCTSSSPAISNNNISNNNDNGIYCYSSSSPTISDNTISNNNDGIYVWWGSSPIISNNTICNNNESGIYCSSSSNIFDNILFENNIGIEASSTPSSLEYNLFWENDTTATGEGLPAAFGEIVTVNVNGDPCDTYYNLFMDPLFVEPGIFNFHLTENSPCIDAGDPDPVYYDPDGTMADIGAFYYDQGVGINEIAIHNVNIYPNPSQGIFNIENVKQESEIEIFNAFGTQVFYDKLNGTEKIDLSENPNGVYIVKISNSDGIHFKKVILN